MCLACIWGWQGKYPSNSSSSMGCKTSLHCWNIFLVNLGSKLGNWHVHYLFWCVFLRATYMYLCCVVLAVTWFQKSVLVSWILGFPTWLSVEDFPLFCPCCEDDDIVIVGGLSIRLLAAAISWPRFHIRDRSNVVARRLDLDSYFFTLHHTYRNVIVLSLPGQNSKRTFMFFPKTGISYPKFRLRLIEYA